MAAEFKDCYAVLGVTPDVSPEEIKRAFRKQTCTRITPTQVLAQGGASEESLSMPVSVHTLTGTGSVWCTANSEASAPSMVSLARLPSSVVPWTWELESLESISDFVLRTLAAVALLVAALGTGRAGHRSYAKHEVVLETTRPAHAARQHQDIVLAVRDFTIDPVYEGTGLRHCKGESEDQSDFYHGFVIAR